MTKWLTLFLVTEVQNLSKSVKISAKVSHRCLLPCWCSPFILQLHPRFYHHWRHHKETTHSGFQGLGLFSKKYRVPWKFQGSVVWHIVDIDTMYRNELINKYLISKSSFLPRDCCQVLSQKMSVRFNSMT